MNTLIEKVKNWAHERNLINGSDSKTQCLKLVSEVGELSDSINKQRNLADDIGDCLVVLTIIAEQNSLELSYCLNQAYSEIKDRKGVMLDGVFIKDTDEAYQGALAVIAARRVHLPESLREQA